MKAPAPRTESSNPALEYFVTEWLAPLAVGVVLLGGFVLSTARAQSIAVYNGDFSIATNADTHGGLLGQYDGIYGSGPNGWSVDTNGITVGIVSLLSPTVAITSGVSGNATASGLLNATVPVVNTVVNNNFTIYNNNVTAGTASAGTTFITGRIYTVTADFSSSTALSVNLFNASGTGAGGIGIGLRAAGSDVSTTLGNASAVNLLTGTSGRLTLTYTAAASDNGDSIGITLFAGDGTAGLATLNALGNFSFDNVTLSVAAIPEPATWAAFMGASMLGFALMRRRRFASRPAGGQPPAAS